MTTTHPTLGSELSRHGYARLARNRRLVAATLCLLVAGGVAALIVYSQHAPPSPRETPAQRRAAEWGFAAFGALFVGGAALSLLGIRGERDVEARVYARGFTYRARGGDVATLAWDRVESFVAVVRVMDVHGVPVRTIRRYEVRGEDGTSITFGDTLADAQGLAGRIVVESLPRLHARARDAITRGLTVEFGPLAATREGVTRGGATLEWTRVAAVEVDRYGALVVRERDARKPWASVAAGEVVNLNVLLRVADELRSA